MVLFGQIWGANGQQEVRKGPFVIDQNQTSKTFTINEKFNYQQMTDNYEEKSYEENIKRNLAIAIAQKLILRLSIPQ